MGSGPGGNHPGQVTGDDDIGVGAADASLGPFAEGVQTAGAHDTVPATETQLTKAAMRLLGLSPLPDSFHAFPAGFLIHGQGIGLNGDLFGRDQSGLP